MQSVIQKTYDIILSCNNKYNIDSMKECMNKQIKNVVDLGMKKVRMNPSNPKENKRYIMNLVITSLNSCANLSNASKNKKEQMKQCIQSHIQDLISIAVDIMTMTMTMTITMAMK